MIVIENDKSLFVDVDDTLCIWSDDHTSWIGNQKVITLIKKFNLRNQPVVVWSAGGYMWALEVVKVLGLESHVTLVCSKPAWWVDDLKAEEILLEINRIDPAKLK